MTGGCAWRLCAVGVRAWPRAPYRPRIGVHDVPQKDGVACVSRSQNHDPTSSDTRMASSVQTKFGGDLQICLLTGQVTVDVLLMVNQSTLKNKSRRHASYVRGHHSEAALEQSILRHARRCSAGLRYADRTDGQFIACNQDFARRLSDWRPRKDQCRQCG